MKGQRMKRHYGSIMLVALSMLASASGWGAEALKMPAVGDQAPLVEGIDQDGKPFKLSELIGKQVVLLYFYPKDDTPGCTAEACGWRDRMSELKKEHVAVIGVSFDSADSHRQFREKYQLNFPLLVDANGAIADAYGVRRAPGAKFAKRVSFLIGLDGRIVHVTDNPAAKVHLDEVKSAIAKLPAR